MGEEIKKYRIVISENASFQLEGIYFYLNNIVYSPEAANNVVNAILNTIYNSIAYHPYSHKECPEIPTKTKIYRQAICYRHLIVYKIKDKEIIILGIIHGARHPKQIRKLRN